MKKYIVIIAAAFLGACQPSTGSNQEAGQPATPITNRKATVYTTADSTHFRITATDTLDFTDMAQPFETQPCVFVDPDAAFQQFEGFIRPGLNVSPLPAAVLSWKLLLSGMQTAASL
jgi:glucosylceramidase